MFPQGPRAQFSPLICIEPLELCFHEPTCPNLDVRMPEALADIGFPFFSLPCPYYYTDETFEKELNVIWRCQLWARGEPTKLGFFGYCPDRVRVPKYCWGKKWKDHYNKKLIREGGELDDDYKLENWDTALECFCEWWWYQWLPMWELKRVLYALDNGLKRYWRDIQDHLYYAREPPCLRFMGQGSKHSLDTWFAYVPCQGCFACLYANPNLQTYAQGLFRGNYGSSSPWFDSAPTPRHDELRPTLDSYV